MTRLIPDRKVRERYHVSTMTMWRFDHDRSSKFPKPVWVRGRKYRDEDELNEYDRQLLAQRDAVSAS